MRVRSTLIAELDTSDAKSSSAMRRLLPKEKTIINRGLIKAGLDGNHPFASQSQAIHAIAPALQAAGFNLALVTGDELMGKSGSRKLSFSRQDPTDPRGDKEHQREIANSVIMVSWHQFQSGNFEVTAYAS